MTNISASVRSDEIPIRHDFSYFQAIFTLSQVTGILAPRKSAFLTNQASKRAEHEKNVICYDSLLEAARNCDPSFIRILNTNILYENQILNKFNTSYVSNDSFFENKYGFPECSLGNEKPSNTLVLDKNKTFHVPYAFYKSFADGLRHKNKFLFDVQVRGFKTDRNIKVELQRNPPLLSRIKNNLGIHGTDVELKTPQEASKMKQLLGNEEVGNDAEKQRIKVAFAEGYLLGTSGNKSSKAARYFKIFQQVLTVVIFLAIVISLMASANGSMFR